MELIIINIYVYVSSNHVAFMLNFVTKNKLREKLLNSASQILKKAAAKSSNHTKKLWNPGSTDSFNNVQSCNGVSYFIDDEHFI